MRITGGYFYWVVTNWDSVIYSHEGGLFRLYNEREGNRMKKFSITSKEEAHTHRCKDIKEAIKFKNEELCPYQYWIIRELLQVRVKTKISKRKLMRSK